MSNDPGDRFVQREDRSVYETAEPVLYEARDGIARITMNRPQFNNAQNSQMTYALDAALRRATDDDAVKVIVLAGAGKHFSAGHDIGTPGRDIDKPFERQSLWWDHTNKPGGEQYFVREQEVYLGMCRRWHDIPKPTIAMVQGACIAGGLMLAWVCDLIVASDDAFFAEPLPFLGGQAARQLWRETARRIAAVPVHRQDAFADEVVNTELDKVLDQGKAVAAALADARRQLERRARR